MAYKMRSFSFPLYPYPRYRTPTSEDLTFDFGDNIHDTRPESDFVLVDSPVPYYASNKYSTEPESQSPVAHVEKADIPMPQTVAGLRPIHQSLKNIESEVERCVDNMNTLLICSGLVFSGVLILLSRQYVPTENMLTISHIHSDLPSLALWMAALALDILVARLCLSVKQQLKASELRGRHYQSLRNTFNVRLYRPRDLATIFQLASLLPMLLHISLVLLLVGCGASLVDFTLANTIRLFVVASVLTTGVLYIFHATTVPSPLRYGVQVLAPAIVRTVLSLSSSLQRGYIAMMGSMDFETSEQTEAAEDDPPLPEEELTPSGNVVNIVTKADEILADDDLFAAAIVPVVQSNSNSIPTTVLFVLRSLEHRLPHLNFPREHKDSQGLLYLRGLQLRAWEAIIDLVADVVARYLVVLGDGKDQAPRFVTSWIKTAMSILFSHSDYPLTANGKCVVAQLLSPQYVAFTCRHVIKRSQSLADIWHGFRRVLPARGACDYALVVEHVLRARFCTHDCAHESMAEWAAHTHADARWHVGDAFDALADVVGRHVPDSPEASWSPAIEELLLVMLRWAQRWNSVEKEENMARPIFRLLCRPDTVLATRSLSAPVAAEFLRFLSHCTIAKYEFERVSVAGRAAILRNITAMLERYAEGALEGSSDIDVLRLARRPLWMLEQTVSHSHKNWEQWRPLLCALAQTLQQWHDQEQEAGAVKAASREAGHCLVEIAQLTKLPGWVKSRLTLPCELIEALHVFLRPGEFRGVCVREEAARMRFGREGRVGFEPETRAHMLKCQFALAIDEDEDEEALLS